MIDFIKEKLPKPIKIPLRKLYYFIRSILGIDIPSNLPNLKYNKRLFDKYAKNWNNQKINILYGDYDKKERNLKIKHVGDEWAKYSDTKKIIEEFIYPFITQKSIIAEIGVGGGRIALETAARVKELFCFDVSSQMLKKAKTALIEHSNIKYTLLNESQLPLHFQDKFDFVYAFDVFVHLDIHNIWKYFKEIKRVLKKGGKAFIHTTNLKAPGGWNKFSKQDRYNVITQYFISPEIVQIFAEHSGLKIIKTSIPDATNIYLKDGYLAVLEK